MKKRTKRKINKAGYTLIELLVVIAIIGLFTGMSAVAFSAVRNRTIGKYSKMVNTVISDFYKNATTKEGDWKMEITVSEESGVKTYKFTQYHLVVTERHVGPFVFKDETWNPYYTESIDGNLVYAVKEVKIDDCTVKFYKDGTEVVPTDSDPIQIFISRERAVFDESKSEADKIVFSNSNVKSTINIVLGTPNNYIARS